MKFCNVVKFLFFYLLTCCFLINGIHLVSQHFPEYCSVFLLQHHAYVYQIMTIFAFFYIILYYAKRKIKKKTEFVFYCLSFIAIVTLLYLSYFTNGEILKSILFSDRQDTFMDYFNCVVLGDSPYSRSFIAIYPPLAMLKFYILGACSGVSSAESGFPWHEVAIKIRCSQVGMTVFGLYTGFILFSLTYLWSSIKKGNHCERISFILAMFFSMPFVYTVERGNNILIALFFIFCFVYFYQHRSRKIQIISFACLAIATSIKISPFIYALILLRDKRYKDFCIVCVLACVIFFLPFLFFQGNVGKQLCIMINNIMISSENYSNAVFPSFFINIEQLMAVFVPKIFATQLKWLIVICGILEILYFKHLQKWETFAILSILAIIIPSFSAVYALVYMMVPLMLFLDRAVDENHDLVFTFLFLGIFLVIPNLFLSFRLSTLIETLCLIEMVLLLEFRGISNALLKKI